MTSVWPWLIVMLGQTLVSGLLIVFVRQFGQYTETNRAIHRTNIEVLERQEAILVQLDTLVNRLPPDERAA